MELEELMDHYWEPCMKYIIAMYNLANPLLKELTIGKLKTYYGIKQCVLTRGGTLVLGLRYTCRHAKARLLKASATPQLHGNQEKPHTRGLLEAETDSRDR